MGSPGRGDGGVCVGSEVALSGLCVLSAALTVGFRPRLYSVAALRLKTVPSVTQGRPPTRATLGNATQNFSRSYIGSDF